MGAGRYLLGVAILGAILVPAALSAVRLRRWFLPAWAGAEARLAEAVIALSWLVVVAEILGLAGLLTTLPMVAASAALAIAVGAATRSQVPGARPRPIAPVAVTAVAAVVLVSIVAAQWTLGTADALEGGIVEEDSLTYHLPFAARFVQEGSITSAHFIGPGYHAQTVFHPANSELLHAVAMLPFHRDVLAPLLGLGWFALALLAGWCVGAVRGVAPVSMVGTALVLATPVMVATQAGSAMNDVAVIALVLAAAALLLHGAEDDEDRPVIALVGLAAGLAVGTKLSAVVPVAGIAIAAIVSLRRGRRVSAAAVWAVAAALTGAFWYVRNLVLFGNPVPRLGIGIGPLALPTPDIPELDELGYSVADYLTDDDVWREAFVPGLELSFGPAWPALLVLAAAGIAAAIITGSRHIRLLGAAAAVAAVAYVITPTTAFGPRGAPFLFAINLRYLTPALAIGLVLLPTARLLRSRGKAAAVLAAYAVVLLSQQTADGLYQAWPDRHRLAAVAGGVGVAGGWTAWRWWASGPRSQRLLLIPALACAVLLVGMGWTVQRDYLRTRYADAPWAAVPAFRWARGVSDARIAVAGIAVQYPLYGTDLSNTVQYVGTRGDHGAFMSTPTCRTWRRALADRSYDYVVTGPTYRREREEPREAQWTRSDPGVTEVLRRGDTAVFSVAAVSVEGCD